MRLQLLKVILLRVLKKLVLGFDVSELRSWFYTGLQYDFNPLQLLNLPDVAF